MDNNRFVERRAIISQEEAKALLEPHLPLLEEDFKAAWDFVQDILNQDPERRSTFDISTQAAMIFNRFVRLTHKRFNDVPGVLLKSSGRMMKMIINGKLSLRFKKFDGKLRSKNVRTNQQLKMYFQLQLDGMDTATEVTFGYKTDATGLNVTGVYVTCPVGWGTNRWVIVVNEREQGDALPFIAPEPVTPFQPDNSIQITPKEVKKPEGQ